MSTTFIGIDPGLDGGMAVLSEKNVNFPATVYKTPIIGGKEYDIQAMREMLDMVIVTSTRIFTVIENQISMPGQGLTSTLQTGKGFGIWLGLLAGLGIPYQIVGAKQWQSKLFTGVKTTLDTKAKSEIIAKRLFPGVDFRKSDRSRVANDGLTDAILMAEYGRRLTGGVGMSISGISHAFLESNPLICTACGAFLPDSDPNDCRIRPDNIN